MHKPLIRLGFLVGLVLMLAIIAISLWRLQRVTVLGGSLGGTWEFESLEVDGHVIYANVPSSVRPNLYFAKGHFGGSDGCNDFKGDMQLDWDGRLTITGYSSTQMGCQVTEMEMNGEQPIGRPKTKYDNNVFIKALLSATALEVIGGELKLYYPANRSSVLIFRRRAGP